MLKVVQARTTCIAAPSVTSPRPMAALAPAQPGAALRRPQLAARGSAAAAAPQAALQPRRVLVRATCGRPTPSIASVGAIGGERCRAEAPESTACAGVSGAARRCRRLTLVPAHSVLAGGSSSLLCSSSRRQQRQSRQQVRWHETRCAVPSCPLLSSVCRAVPPCSPSLNAARNCPCAASGVGPSA